MSGFSPDWLALREPADIAARNIDVVAAMAQHFSARKTITVCDLGAGTGASLRAVADRLPPVQSWVLVDHDARNLEAAVAALAAWADESARWNEGITLRRGRKMIDVRVRVQDFAHDLVCWSPDTDLVTASALFDLASADWITSFVSALRKNRIALLSMLTANDDIGATPPHAADSQIIAAFHRHQTSDKGFGPSAGAKAARILEETLARAGYRLTAGDSPWLLSPSALRDAVVGGMAAAVSQTGDVAQKDIDQWLKHQREEAQNLRIGHRDVFAQMP